MAQALFANGNGDSHTAQDITLDPPSTPPSPTNTTTLPTFSRQHSGSISSVHFLHPLPHRDSTSSLRSDNPAPAPIRPLAKTRSSSPIRSPIPAQSSPHQPTHVTTPSKQSHHVQNQSPAHPPLGTDYFTRKNSQDRRIRSEGSPLSRPERSGSLIGNKASKVTGGYESSSSDEITDPGNALGHLMTLPIPMSARSRTSMPASQSFSANRSVAFGVSRHHSDEGRKRAMSLMSPTMEEMGTPNGLVNRPRHKSRESSRRSSRDALRNAHAHDVSRRASTRHEPPPATPEPGPSKRTPDGDVPRANASPASDRKGKGKERKLDSLAASLGLQGGRGDIVLSTDQINNLLNDSDVSSALRLLQGGHVAARHTALHPVPSISSGSGPSRPTSPAQREPFIAHAPPALTQDDKHGRDRNVSISSTIAPSHDRNSTIGTTWTSRHHTIDEEDTHRREDLQRRRSRAASRVEPEGGHVPYTHHIPAVHISEDGHDAHSVTTAETHSAGRPSTGSMEMNGHVSAFREKKEGMAGKSRLSQLFHIKRKKSSEKVGSDSPRKLEKPMHPPKDSEKEREQGEKKARDRERAEQETERKRFELERRDAELAQERRYHALTQVAAHPDSERNAYKTSSHLRAYYNHLYDGLDNPPRVNALAVLRWKHRTEEQAELKAKWERDKRGNSSVAELGQVHASPGSIASSRPGQSASSLGKQSGGRWRYTNDDVTAYNDADGIVNYFIPPRQTFDQLSARSPSPNPARSPSPAMNGTSAAGSTEKRSETPRIASASTVSFGIPPSTISNEPLSRSASIERRGKPLMDHREHRLTHRTHQSLSAMGPQSLTHALKAPFEKLGSVARHAKRADTAPNVHTDDESVNRSLPHRRIHVPLVKRDVRSAVEDDRQRDFHLRKLFLKGQRVPDRPDVDRMSSGGAKVHDREAELRALERALLRETAFRERQAEVERQTEQEAEARARLRHLEDEIYAERSKQLDKAKQRLEGLNTNLDTVQDNVRHYLAQIDQLSAVAKVTAEVDAKFPNLGQIRLAYARKPNTKPNRGESVDVLGPLRAVYDSGSGTESRRSGSRQNSSDANRRKVSLGPPNLPPLLALGMKPWPRRTSLDPDGTARVNPIRRVELTINHARNHHSTILGKRDDVLSQLRGMISTIDSLIKQKDALRSWTKAALESNRNLRNTRDSLIADLKGNSSLRMGRFTDSMIDGGIRTIIGPIAQVILFFTSWFKWIMPWSDGGNERRRRSAARRAGRSICGWIWYGIFAGLVIGVVFAIWYGDNEEHELDGRFDWMHAAL